MMMIEEQSQSPHERVIGNCLLVVGCMRMMKRDERVLF